MAQNNLMPIDPLEEYTRLQKPLVFQKRIWVEELPIYEDPFLDKSNMYIEVKILGLPKNVPSNFREYAIFKTTDNPLILFELEKTFNDWAEMLKKNIMEEYENR